MCVCMCVCLCVFVCVCVCAELASVAEQRQAELDDVRDEMSRLLEDALWHEQERECARERHVQDLAAAPLASEPSSVSSALEVCRRDSLWNDDVLVLQKVSGKDSCGTQNRPTNTRAHALGRRRQLTTRALERRWGWRQLLMKPSLALGFVAWWEKMREDHQVWGRSLEEEFTQSLQEVRWGG